MRLFSFDASGKQGASASPLPPAFVTIVARDHAERERKFSPQVRNDRRRQRRSGLHAEAISNYPSWKRLQRCGLVPRPATAVPGATARDNKLDGDNKHA